MISSNHMKIWDYKIPKNWQPPNTEAWIWYIEKMITTGNLRRLPAAKIKKYLPKLRLDEGNRLLFKHFFKQK